MNLGILLKKLLQAFKLEKIKGFNKFTLNEEIARNLFQGINSNSHIKTTLIVLSACQTNYHNLPLESQNHEVMSLSKALSIYHRKKLFQLLLFLSAQSLFPDDIVAELLALHQYLQSQDKPKYLITIIVTRNFIELFWALYIQIRIENIWLSQRKKDR